MKKNILVIHPRCCIRAIKQIEGLIENHNYNITLITFVDMFGRNIPEHIKNKINLINFKFRNRLLKRFVFRRLLKNLSTHYEIVHCHNEPNYYIRDVISVFKNRVPIVYDIHDFTSMRSGNENLNESFAYVNSDYVIHVNNDFISYGDEKYGIKKSSTIYSTPSQKYVKKIRKEKYDNLNRPLHFVYQGGIFDKEHELTKQNPKLTISYRNYYPYFVEILNEGHHVHLFTSADEQRIPNYIKLKDIYENFHYYGNVEYKYLLNKMNKFDYGITGFNLSDIKNEIAIKYLEYAMGNKLFDYIFSGIIPVAINAKSMEKFIINNSCGYIKKDKSWTDTVKSEKIHFENHNLITKQYCMENQIEKLINIYKSIV